MRRLISSLCPEFNLYQTQHDEESQAGWKILEGNWAAADLGVRAPLKSCTGDILKHRKLKASLQPLLFYEFEREETLSNSPMELRPCLLVDWLQWMIPLNKLNLNHTGRTGQKGTSEVPLKLSQSARSHWELKEWWWWWWKDDGGGGVGMKRMKMIWWYWWCQDYEDDDGGDVQVRWWRWWWW